nr:matrix protein [Human metapneumovirus]WAB07549.1 matrix protein [Human metapneumovirus]WAB07612.1 matrix protein [Human metapneumovirus]WAB07747.1 matrix protein [Human metapneumovirus]WAB07783.1 matrix protein [Human metapneumovirus]
MGQVKMESYLVDTYQGIPYTAAVQVDLVEKDLLPASLTIWFPLFQANTPPAVLLDQLKTLTITTLYAASQSGPILKVNASAQGAAMSVLPKKFEVNATVALDEYSKLEFDKLTVCEVKTVYLTTMKPYGMVSKFVSSAKSVGKKTHDLIALCDFMDLEKNTPVTIPAFIKSVSIKESESATVEAAISSEADQALTQAKIAPYAGLIMIMTMNNPKGIFKKLGAGTQVIVELGAYVQAESISKICKTWSHQGTRYVLKSR